MSFNFSVDIQKIDPRAESLLNQADDLMQSRNYKEAAKLYQQSISIQNHEESHYKLGVCYELAGDKDAALKSYRKCIMMNAYHLGALENAGDIYAASGQGLLAIESYGMAIMGHPDVSQLKEKLVGILSFQTFHAMGEPMRQIVLECIKDPQINISYMSLGWLSICETIPAFQSVYKTARYISYEDFKRNFAALANHKGLYDEFFLTGLGRVFAPDIKFERFLTHIRRYALEHPEFWTADEDLRIFMTTLAEYTFLTEYVFAVNESEDKAIQNLIKECSIRSLTAEEMIILSCYCPLLHINGIERCVDALKDNQLVSKIIERQFYQEKKLIRLKEKIETLTPIADDVSRKVQSQYEESPYPRWNGFNKNIKPIEDELWGKNANILIAGCGTGLEAIELAYCFPDAQVLAVDLSRSSIAYGMLKAEEYGISNITYKHADILELGALNQKFDLITSSGVLHHMSDPLAGWKVITKLLKPGGLMRIALYSAHARQSINTVRAVIKDSEIAPTMDNIRSFRQEAQTKIKKPDFEAITAMRDYYTTSECRDLLFHVQEHQFTIPQIQNALEMLGLDFIQFYLTNKTLGRYKNRFKNDPDANDLSNWDQFEKTYPNTFISMYKFWCRKTV
jgi:2-polyprenyl-3-methyl-5-hydroxy-6-metoxy-1,4-benzoquinol methylase